jgi:hypothetical protein
VTLTQTMLFFFCHPHIRLSSLFRPHNQLLSGLPMGLHGLLRGYKDNLYYFYHISRSWVSVIGIATGYGLDDREGVGVPSAGRVKNFLFSTSSRPTLGSTQPPIQWVPEALSPGVKRQGREADHSPLTSANVKKMWSYTSTPPYAFMA